MRRLIISILLFLLIIPLPARADDQVAMVEGQIQMARERLSTYRGELSSALSQLQKSPSDATFRKIREIQDKIQRQGSVVNTLQLALQDARAAQSWSAMIADMVKDSAILSAGAEAASSVYQAGQWIFGVSNDQIFGESWQQVESLNARMVEEARKVREESQAILGALDQIKRNADAGGNAEDLRSLTDTLTRRLRELRERAELVKKNLRLMIRVYRAEKENLPAATLFHGVFMGRYTEQVLAEFDGSKLTDLLLDLIKGDTNDILIKLVKPMVKTAVGDYLARKGGGGNLTPEIIDDLSFGILFGGESGFKALFWDRLGDEGGGAAIKGLVKGVVTAEAQQVIGKSNQAFYGAMRRSIQNLPATAEITEHMLVQETTDQLAKEHKNLIESGARARAKRLVDTGEAVKKVWDLVLKDAIQAWLQKDTFFKAVQQADDECLRFREEWRKVKDDMILTENEYVNFRWFKGGKNAAAPPKEVVGASQPTRSLYADMDLDKGKQFQQQQKEVVKEGTASVGLDYFDSQDDTLVEMVCSGTVPFGRLGFTDLNEVLKITAITLWAPCDELTRKRQQEIEAERAACEAIRVSQNFNAYLVCHDTRVRPKSDAFTTELRQCIETKVDRPRAEFTQRRIARLEKTHACEAKRYKEQLDRIRRELAPAVAWAESVENDVKSLRDLLVKISNSRSGYLYPPPLPALPAEIRGDAALETYDDRLAAESLARLKENLTLARGVDLERLEQALARVDFVFDESILNSVPDLPNLCRKFALQYSTIQCQEAFVPLENETFPLARERILLSVVNPNNLQYWVAEARQVPEIANRPFVEMMLTFSPAQGMGLYRQGMETGRKGAQGLSQLNAAVQEYTSSLGGNALKEIRNFYDYIFVPWKLRRIPSLLGMDLDQLESRMEEMKRTMDRARKTVIPDAAPLLSLVAETEKALGDYRTQYETYGTYRLRHFPGEDVKDLVLPDLSGMKRAIDTQLFVAENYAMEFKAASEALRDMEAEVERMRRTETQHLAEMEAYLRGMVTTADQAAAACTRLPNEPEACLAGVEAARKARQNLVSSSTRLTHAPSAMFRQKRDSLTSTLTPKVNINVLEEEALAAIRSIEAEKNRAQREREIEIAQRETNAHRLITEFYGQFRQAYEGRNDSQLISFLGDDWESGDGTTLADLQGYLRNSFTVFNDIRYQQSNIQIHPSPQGSWRVTYDLTILGRIYADNIQHEEKSSVSEELAFDSRGKLRIVRTIGGRFWSVR